MNTLFKGKLAAMVLALSMVNISAAYAQDENANAKEEGNRNVMLNFSVNGTDQDLVNMSYSLWPTNGQ